MNTKNDPYRNLADDYDKLIGPRDEVGFLLKLIPKSHPRAGSFLEIACGTGTLLKHFAKLYKVSGLENSRDMLKRAKRTLPDAKFYLQDMRKFSLKEKYDIIACLFNSMNHLREYADWKRTFQSSSKHLNKGGVFIFDIMTPLGLKNYASDPDKIIKSSRKFMTTSYSQLADVAFQIHFHVFTKEKNGKYLLNESKIIEKSEDAEKIKSDLKKFFKKVTVIDPDRKRPGANSEVLYFVCKKE